GKGFPDCGGRLEIGRFRARRLQIGRHISHSNSCRLYYQHVNHSSPFPGARSKSEDSMMPDGDRSLAVFIDFENLALGFQGRRERFDIERVLERLVEKGKIVAKKAYCDWSRFGPYT